MRKTLLQQLQGRTVADAERLIKAEGHVPLVRYLGARQQPRETLPNTVILWQETEGVVRMAEAGNPAELQNPGFYNT